jgi:CRISPR-associated protein Csd1
MILQQLYQDSEAILQEAPTPPMYDNILVQWQVKITDDGKFGSCINLGDKGGKRECIPYNYGRSVDIVPNLLVDTADYALGPVAAPDDKKAATKHLAFLHLVQHCAQETQDPLVQSVVRLLEAGGISPEQLPKDLKPKERVMFTVGDEERIPTEADSVRAFWEQETREKCKGKPKTRGQCLITGTQGYVESILPCEIRVGGESAPLISVNESAGCSYGFEQALNGAVSLQAAEGFTKALSSLMRNPDAHLRVGDVTYVFWRRTGPDGETARVLDRPDENGEMIAHLLATPSRPQQRPGAKTAARTEREFFAVALSGNKTRVVFRDWMALTEQQVNDHLGSWLTAQQIVSPAGEDQKRNGHRAYFSVREMAAACYRESKEIRKADVTALVRTALHGDPVPRRMVAAAIRRCCIEGRVTHARAALLKLDRTRPDKEKATLMATSENMDRFSDNPAYVCGRLLAVLESLEYAALKGVKSSIIDHYFSAVVAAPRRIFGLLLPKAESAYLAKLRRRSPGLYWLYKDQINALLDHVGPENAQGLPAMKDTQSLAEQADFLLGYYHQEAHYRAERKKNAAARDSKKKSDAAQAPSLTENA